MANTYDYAFSCEALNGQLRPSTGPADSVIVTHWRGTEGVSRLYRFDITIAVDQGGITLEKLLNQTATLSTRTPDGGTRQWNGIITQASEEGRDETHYYYQVTLEPRLARLRAMRWSDIYLNCDLADLIKQLLDKAGLNEPYSTDNAPYDYRIAATQLTQTKADFVCQFEETCLDFLMRKLEHYGVYFWFEQGSGQESVVFANDVSQQPATADSAVYYPRGTIDPDARSIAITQLRRRVAMPPSAVVLHDSNDQSNTSLSLSSQVDVPRPQSAQALGVIHSAQAHFEQLEGDGAVSGTALATWRAQEAACHRLRAEGHARTPGIRAGRFLDVSEYQHGNNDRSYYVIEVTHEGTQTLETLPQTDLEPYRADFVAVSRYLDPDDDSTPLQYRPPLATPRPQVDRLINGFIDITTPNSPQQYAKPDSDGRYKVRFLFARQRYDGDQNSAFVRMATPYAGAASSSDQILTPAGMHFPLREGTEVLIAFLNGDPDRPVIVSSLPNTESPSVVKEENAAQHVITTPSGNTLVMADANEQGENGSASIVLSSPVETSSLTLGTSEEGNGWGLSTANHGNLYAGQSMLIEVPGHYRVAAGGDMSNFLGAEVQNLPSGISIGTSGGIVIENFVGAKVESVEAVAIEHFFGAKAELKEALCFEFNLAATVAVEASGKKEFNLLEKEKVDDVVNHAGNNLVEVWAKIETVAPSKLDTIGKYSIVCAADYEMLSPSAFLGSEAACIWLTPAGTAISGETLVMEAVTTAILRATESLTLQAAASAFTLTGPEASLLSENVTITGATSTEITGGGQLACAAPIINLN